MSLRLLFAPIAVTSLSLLFAACSSDDSKPSDGAGGAGGASDGTGGRKVVTNFDCSAEKWSNVSDSCWSCMCDACKDTLDACQQDCTDVFDCALEKQTLVNVLGDLACEIRATGNECATDEAHATAALGPLTAFDTCLLFANPKNKDGEFRTCETECGIKYPGDVCARFPAAPANP